MLGKMYKKGLDMSVRWKKTGYDRESYTIILALPADLPCMAYYVTEYLQQIDLTHCKEIIVTIDQAEDYVTPLLAKVTLPIRLVSSKHLLVGATKSPYKYHWMQMVAGLNACKTEYAILKGCNLYMYDKQFYERYFAALTEHRPYMAGIRERPETPGVKVGTYEMAISMRVKDEARPIELLAGTHDGIPYDNLLYVQRRLLEKYGDGAVVHYNKAIDRTHFGHFVGQYRTTVKSGTKDDFACVMWFLALSNELVPAKWKRDFISLDAYYKTYTPVFPDDIYHLFLENLAWVKDNFGLEQRFEQEIERLQKVIVVKDCSDHVKHYTSPKPQ